MKIFSSSGEYLRSKSDLVDQVLNTCQSKKNQRIFFLALVKFKMAERFFKENPPLREISRFLRWNKGGYASQTDNSTQLRQISSFYSQLEVAVDTLEAKHTSNVS